MSGSALKRAKIDTGGESSHISSNFEYADCVYSLQCLQFVPARAVS